MLTLMMVTIAMLVAICGVDAGAIVASKPKQTNYQRVVNQIHDAEDLRTRPGLSIGNSAIIGVGASGGGLRRWRTTPVNVRSQTATTTQLPFEDDEDYEQSPPSLLRHLLRRYNKDVPPISSDGTSPVMVYSRLFPVKLLHLYDKNEVLEMTIRIQLTWQDPKLRWDPADFNNQSAIVIPSQRLWVPDIQIANSASDLYALLRDEKFDFKVHYDGSVWWHPTGILMTRCELNLKYFPFDQQNCPIQIESAIYAVDKLNVTLRQDKSPVSQSMYVESGNWILLDVTGRSDVLWVTKSTGFARVEFWLLFGRKTSYFKLNIIFPCCMLSGLQMLTFFFPLESQERVPQATSILLSVIVFQSMIVDQLPKSSDSIPLLCIYIAMLTCISVIAVGESVLIAGLVSRKDKRTKAPKWAHNFLKTIYRWSFAEMLDARDYSKTPNVMAMISLVSDSGRKNQTSDAEATKAKLNQRRRFPNENYRSNFHHISIPSISIDEAEEDVMTHFDPPTYQINNANASSQQLNSSLDKNLPRHQSLSRTASKENSHHRRLTIAAMEQTDSNGGLSPSVQTAVLNNSPSGFSYKSRPLSTNTLSLPRRSEVDRRRMNSLFTVDYDGDIYLDWLYLARLIDAFMFIISTLFIIFIPVIFFAILPPDYSQAA